MFNCAPLPCGASGHTHLQSFCFLGEFILNLCYDSFVWAISVFKNYFMKRIAIFFLASGLAMLSFFTVASATSGACSSHGGVSCSAGSDSDGSVICKDGWRDSSVLYSDMAMCSADNGFSAKTYDEDLPTVVQPQVSESFFTDVPNSNLYFSAIDHLKELNVVGGYSDGSFKPFSKINRAEFTKIVLNALHVSDSFAASYPDENSLSSLVPVDGCFPDVRKTDWFAKYVCYAKKMGMIDGYPDGKFHPENQINTMEAMKIVFEAVTSNQVPEFDGTWYAKYEQYATDNNLWVDEWEKQSEVYQITRGEMAEFVEKSVF